MKVIGTIEVKDSPVEVTSVRVKRGGGTAAEMDAVQTEGLLSVYVNDTLTMRLGCSAGDLVELVVGRLFTEGFIESVDEIDAISVCERSLRADVILADRSVSPHRDVVEVTPTCCTNNVVVSRLFSRNMDLQPVTPIRWDSAQIFRICDEFGMDRTIHARTHGAHSAYLCSRTRTLCVREDIGRHNAFDKVIGWALMNGVDLSQCIVYTSGRVPTDMVVKAIRAGIPILVSKAVATDKTVEFARSYNLTLICEGTAESFLVMNNPLAG